MLVLVTLALLTPFFADLPKATLAAVVIAAVLPLLKTASLRRLYRIDKADFSIALVCLSGVLVLGVLGGIVVAVVASLVALVYRSFRPEVAVLGRSHSRETDEDIGFRDVSRHRDVETFPGLVIFRFDQEIFFANATFFRDQIRHSSSRTSPPPRDDPRRRRRRHPHRHDRASTCSATSHDELSAEGISLEFARIKGPVRDTLARAGLVRTVRPRKLLSHRRERRRRLRRRTVPRKPGRRPLIGHVDAASPRWTTRRAPPPLGRRSRDRRTGSAST